MGVAVVDRVQHDHCVDHFRFTKVEIDGVCFEEGFSVGPSYAGSECCPDDFLLFEEHKLMIGSLVGDIPWGAVVEVESKPLFLLAAQVRYLVLNVELTVEAELSRIYASCCFLPVTASSRL